MDNVHDPAKELNFRDHSAAFRYYIDSQHMAVILPFDLNVDGRITRLAGSMLEAGLPRAANPQ